MKSLFLIAMLFGCSIIVQAQKNTSQLLAAQAFLKTLDKDQYAKATFPFDTAERYHWFYVPIARKGLPTKEMNVAQKEAAMNLLKVSLSNQADQKVLAIMQLEIILKEIENRKPEDNYRDTGKYYFSVFGKPDAKEPWGWRVDGHHVSMNFSSVDGKIASATPSFMGSNPGRVPSGAEAGKQILKDEADLGFEMLASLSEEQRKKAIYSETAPGDIITVNSKTAKIDKIEGIPFTDLNKEQKQKLMKLISLYIHTYPFGFADEFMRKIEKAGLEKLTFAWSGADAWGKGHYYRIQNPVLLIEYDNTQNNANHIHTVVRDLTNDWGEDMLKKHYEMEHKK